MDKLNDELLVRAVKVLRNVAPCRYQPEDAMWHVGIPWDKATSSEFLGRFDKLKQAVDAVLGRATFRGRDRDIIKRALNLAKLHHNPMKLRMQDTHHILLLAGSTCNLPHMHHRFMVKLRKLQGQLAAATTAKRLLTQVKPKQTVVASSFNLSTEDIRRMSKKTRDVEVLLHKAVETYRNVPGRAFSGYHAMVHVGIEDPLNLQDRFRQYLQKEAEEKGPATFSNDDNELLRRSISLLLLSHQGVFGKQNCSDLIRLAGGTSEEHTNSGRFHQKFYRERNKLRERFQVSIPSALPPLVIECSWNTEDTDMADNISPLTVTESELIGRSFIQKHVPDEQELQRRRAEQLVTTVPESEGQGRSDIITVDGSAPRAVGVEAGTGMVQLEAGGVSSSADIGKPITTPPPVGKSTLKGTPTTVALLSDEDTSYTTNDPILLTKITIARGGISLLHAELTHRGIPFDRKMRIKQLKTLLKRHLQCNRYFVPLSSEMLEFCRQLQAGML